MHLQHLYNVDAVNTKWNYKWSDFQSASTTGIVAISSVNANEENLCKLVSLCTRYNDQMLMQVLKINLQMICNTKYLNTEIVQFKALNYNKLQFNIP